jgi:hypothetical protein
MFWIRKKYIPIKAIYSKIKCYRKPHAFFVGTCFSYDYENKEMTDWKGKE